MKVQVRTLKPGDRFNWRGKTYELQPRDGSLPPGHYVGKRGKTEIETFLGGQEVEVEDPIPPGQMPLFEVQ